MPIVDLRRATERKYEAIIVGSGPAGTASALSLSESGHSVLLIDAGSEAPSTPPPNERLIPQSHAAAEDSHCRAFGGTSWTWGGRIMPFTEAEFQHYAWPVEYETVARHFDEAATFLGGSPLGRPFTASGTENQFDLDSVEMMAPDGPVSERHRARLDASTGPDILLSTLVVGMELQTAQSGQTVCTGVRLRSGTDAIVRTLSARVTIVAGGGIETTRLLLADKARHASLAPLSGLGIKYQGHLTGVISNITFPKRTDTREYGWRLRPTGGYQRRVFRSLRPAIEDDMNMFFWARNWPEEDPKHGSGILSTKYLLSRLRGPRDVHPTSGPGRPQKVKASLVLPHLRNMITDAPVSLRAAPDLFRALRNRPRRYLDHLIPNHANCYKLSYHAEQKGRAENFIEITGQVQPDTLPDIRINFDFSEVDVDAVVRAHYALKTELEAAGLAKLDFDVEPDKLHDVVKQNALDGYHQVGTAGMGTNATDSVVDGNCKIHCIEGAYLAGSSIFPNSGAPTPTHTIVAFALRMAHHISGNLKAEPDTKSASVRPKETVTD